MWWIFVNKIDAADQLVKMKSRYTQSSSGAKHWCGRNLPFSRYFHIYQVQFWKIINKVDIIFFL